MSYRNPQIIVDRSAEIWAQSMTKFSENLVGGLEKYYAAKREAAEKKKKIDDAKQLYRNKAIFEGTKEINESAAKIKDPSLMEQFTTNATNMLTEGEPYKYKGVEYNISAIDAQTEIAVNPNLTPDQIAAYTNIALSSTKYQTDMLDKTGAVIANLQPLQESGAYQIGNTIDIAGQGIDEYKNLVAANALLNQKADGVNTKKELTRRRNEDGSYSNMLSVNASFDTKSDVWQNLKKAYDLSDEDASFTWERDVDKWAGQGDLVVSLTPDVDTNEALIASGFIDDKHNQTSKGFVSKLVTTRNVQDGREFVTTESHFDANQLRNDKVYRDAIAGKAANILAMEQDQVAKYVSNNLGWGDKITAENLYASNITPEQRENFIEEQLMEKDLRKIMPNYKTRTARQSDVDAYNNDTVISEDIKKGLTEPLKLGDTLYYIEKSTTSTKVSEDRKQKPTVTEKKQQEADKRFKALEPKIDEIDINVMDIPGAVPYTDIVDLREKVIDLGFAPFSEEEFSGKDEFSIKSKMQSGKMIIRADDSKEVIAGKLKAAYTGDPKYLVTEQPLPTPGLFEAPVLPGMIQ